jgi:putative phosphoribosyl transferase
VFIVRKLGVPGQEELGFGAIASGGFRVLNKDVIDSAHLSKTAIDLITERETQELKRRERVYRANRPQINVGIKTVIIVDDGLATGATMRAAVNALNAQNPYEIVIAVPISSQQTCDEFKHDENVNCICAQIPEPLYGVGVWYRDFSQTTDAEVCALLARAEMEQKSSRRNVA